MGLPKSKNQVGLGNSLMNDRFGKGKKSNMHRGGTAPSKGGIMRTDMDGNEYIVNENQADDWVKMRSITEQGALDEFLSTAELAGTDFTAEKMNNVKIIHRDQKNPYLLSAAEQSVVSKKQNSKRARLTVPRRPAWDKEMTAGELHEREKAAFLEWRRNLAELQEIDDLLMTPFERNLEVWRQLWRVIERSDLVGSAACVSFGGSISSPSAGCGILSCGGGLPALIVSSLSQPSSSSPSPSPNICCSPSLSHSSWSISLPPFTKSPKKSSSSPSST